MKAVTRHAWARLVRSLFGAALCALAAAMLDAGWARAAGGQAVGQRALAVYLEDAGMLAPLALVVGLAAWLFGMLLDEDLAPSPRALAAALRVTAIGRPADVAAFVPLAVLGAFLWATTSAHLARAVLSIDVAPALAGAAVATGALGLGLVAALVVLAITPPLRHSLATASESVRACVDPAVTGGVGLVIAACLFAFGVATGSVSGEGGFFGIWGIFRRPELDLRAPALLLAIFVAGLFGPSATGGMRKTIAFGLAVLPLGLTARAATALAAEPAVARAIERGAPLARPMLSTLRRLTDRDHDGFSPYFGGGDCNDANAEINPLAREIPDNGIDEDCDGKDLTKADLDRALPPPTPSSSAVPQAAAPAPAALPEDLNLVFITIDTVRAELGFLGYPRAVSPNIDKLAARSTVFERAYALASYTGKSVGPMFIGKYPSETHRNWGHFNQFTKEDKTVAERLHDAGVRTMAVHGHRYFGAYSGLHRGFDVLDMSAAPPEGSKWAKAEEGFNSDKVSDAALAQLAKEENTGGRFFLWAHYLDPHADYVKHEGGPDFGRDQRDLYDGEIAFVDKHVGRLLDAIAAAPWAKKTAVIITSDHGEAFGEHKMWRHGSELWEVLVRVPLVVHVPGAPPSRVAARRGAIDLAPTMLEAMGVPLPDGSSPSDFLSGVSLLPDVFAKPGDKPAARDVVIDMPGGPFNDPRRALIHGDLKLVVSNGVKMELYDLAKDPEEAEDVWAADPARQEAMRALYQATTQRLREVKVTGERQQ